MTKEKEKSEKESRKIWKKNLGKKEKKRKNSE